MTYKFKNDIKPVLNDNHHTSSLVATNRSHISIATTVSKQPFDMELLLRMHQPVRCFDGNAIRYSASCAIY